MRKLVKLLGLMVVALSLVTAACDSKKGGEETEKKEKEEESEAEEPEKDEAEEEEEEAEEEKAEKEETDAGEASEEDYISASAELACIDMKLEKKKEADMTKIEETVLGKYGFDQESFKKAEEKFGGGEGFEKKVDKKLEECTPEKAKQYAGMAEEGGEEAKEEKPKPKPTPKVTGRLEGKASNTSGFKNVNLELSVSKDFSASGKFRGVREGKGFSIGLTGKVTKDNQVELSGSKGKNKATVKGSLSENGATVKVSGTVWDQDFTVSMSPKK